MRRADCDAVFRSGATPEENTASWGSTWLMLRNAEKVR
jgi:hypothetical protein